MHVTNRDNDSDNDKNNDKIQKYKDDTDILKNIMTNIL